MSAQIESFGVGFGTWKIAKDVAEEVVYQAIKAAGVRHLDCACDYSNEIEVGKGIARAIAEGVVCRGDLWITSKLWNTFHKKEHVALAASKSLSDLGIEYFDLFMIHFPISLKFVPFDIRYPPGKLKNMIKIIPYLSFIKTHSFILFSQNGSMIRARIPHALSSSPARSLRLGAPWRYCRETAFPEE